MDTLTFVLGAAVALQSLQTLQIAILRRDVRRSMRPPPPPLPSKASPLDASLNDWLDRHHPKGRGRRDE
jgi:hypothetical protein